MRAAGIGWVAALAVFSAPEASAQAPEPAAEPHGDFLSRVTLQVPVVTVHTPDDEAFNNENWGLLADVALNDHWSLVGGAFRNSYDRDTVLAGVSWQPLSVRVAEARLRFGGMLAVDLNGGYRPYNAADPLVAGFNARLSAADPDRGSAWRRLGLLLTVIPPAPENGSTAVNLSVTYRLR